MFYSAELGTPVLVPLQGGACCVRHPFCVQLLTRIPSNFAATKVSPGSLMASETQHKQTAAAAAAAAAQTATAKASAAAMPQQQYI